MNPGPQGLYEDQYVFSINVNKRDKNNKRNINLRTLLWDEMLIIIMYIINLIVSGLKKAHEIIEALLRLAGWKRVTGDSRVKCGRGRRCPRISGLGLR